MIRRERLHDAGRVVLTGTQARTLVPAPQDPFSFTAGQGGLFAFLEAKPRTIAECGWNSGWVKG